MYAMLTKGLTDEAHLEVDAILGDLDAVEAVKQQRLATIESMGADFG